MQTRDDDQVAHPSSRTDAPATVTVYRTEVGHYRRPLFGAPWFAGLIIIPAVLAFLGGAMGGKPAAPAASATPAATSAAPAATGTQTPTAATTRGVIANALLTVIRDGKTVTLSGNVPDAATQSAYSDALTKAFGADATVKGALTVKSGSFAVDAATMTELGTAMKDVAGVTVDVKGTAASILGAAPTEEARNALVGAVVKAFAGAKVSAGGLVIGDPTQAPASCDAAADYVRLVTAATKIQFAPAGTALTPESQTALKQLAEGLKKCTSVKLLVAGNTDNKGTAAQNETISQTRADAVKTALVKLGLKAANITTIANGSSKPIVSNDTDAGRALNRRVDISVQ